MAANVGNAVIAAVILATIARLTWRLSEVKMLHRMMFDEAMTLRGEATVLRTQLEQSVDKLLAEREERRRKMNLAGKFNGEQVRLNRAQAEKIKALELRVHSLQEMRKEDDTASRKQAQTVSGLRHQLEHMTRLARDEKAKRDGVLKKMQVAKNAFDALYQEADDNIPF
jgi:predicted RNase H-like nuclease (RuvC/YqgF family)